MPTDSPRPIAPGKKPSWIRVRWTDAPAVEQTRASLLRHSLNTVCESAQCPNLGACWAQGHATVMLLGAHCTRNCRFCGVSAQPPEAVDADEPRRVAAAIAASPLRHVVLTSVTRDDLVDGGAAHWAATIRAVREAAPGVTIEALIPDFGGQRSALQTVAAERPDILGHNLETVPRLYPEIRSGACYARSLDVLRGAADCGLVVKTSLMLGLGETEPEVVQTLRDARAAGTRIAFLGQYLQPTPAHAPVVAFIPPEAFDALRRKVLELGFETVRAAPLLRSSTPPGVADAAPVANAPVAT